MAVGLPMHDAGALDLAHQTFGHKVMLSMADGLADVRAHLRSLASPPDDEEALLSVVDLARGCVPPSLLPLAGSRILPAVQARLETKLGSELTPLLQAARQLTARWGVGRIGGRRFSAEEETASLLHRFEAENASPPPYASTHAALRRWLQSRSERPPAAAELWRGAWQANESFAAFKKPWLVGFLRDMADHGLLGQSVLDVGAGRVAVSDHLRSDGRKLVQIESAGAEPKDHALVLQADIEDEAELTRALVEAGRYLGSDAIDTLVCSNILNYVDFRSVISRLHRVHADNGRLVIFNQPFEGEAELFSRRGASDNYELLRFLVDEGYALEFLQAAPLVHVNDYDWDPRAKTLLVVARNEGLQTG